MTVAIAEPAIPIAGAGPSPRISTGLRMMSSTTLSPMNQSGVIESPDPRRPIIMRTMRKEAGVERKIRRR